MLLRPAQRGDELSVARVHVRSWQVAYRGLMPDEYLDSLRPEDRAARYRFENPDPLAPFTIVAINDGAVVGFGTTARAHDPELPHHGELCALYVDPDHWGAGAGRALMEACRTRLVADLGFHRALLWVLAGNRRAQRFYEKDGWTHDGHERTVTVWGLAVSELRYVRPTSRPTTPSTAGSATPLPPDR